MGKIPKGWSAGTLSDVIRLERESIRPFDFPDEVFAHYSIPAFDEGQMPSLTPGLDIKSNKFAVPQRSVLLSKLNPRIRRIWFPSCQEGNRSICSTEFLVSTPQSDFSTEYIWGLFQSDSFLDEFTTLVTGTSGSHQRVKPEYLLGMKAVIPQVGCVETFSRLCAPHLGQIAANRHQSQALVECRDSLLPRLLSGEIRTNAAEKIASGVA